MCNGLVQRKLENTLSFTMTLYLEAGLWSTHFGRQYMLHTSHVVLTLT